MKVYTIITLLGILFVIIALSFQLKRKTVEGFDTLPDSPLTAQYKALDKKYTNDTTRRYNYVSDGMNDFIGGLWDPGYDNETVITKQIQDALQNVAVTGSTRTQSGNELVPKTEKNTHMPHSYVLDIIKGCEAIKINVATMSDNDITNTCAKLDDPTNRQCGFCLKNGVDSKGKNQVGGLYFSNYDRYNGDQLQANVDAGSRLFKPTVGICDTKNFVTTSARCKRRINEILCEANGGLPQRSPETGNGCGQCVQQGLKFMFNGDKKRTFTAILHLLVDGQIQITFKPSNTQVPSLQVADMNRGLRYVQFIFENVTENDNFTLVNQGNTTNIIAGQWKNPSGSRDLPFYESITDKTSVFIGGNINSTLIQTTIPRDKLLNFRIGTLTVKATKTGAATINGFSGTGGLFNINLQIPGYLGEPLYDEDATTCPTGGILGTPQSMILNKSNPCFSDDPSAPLSQKCLANLFSAAGGNTFGTGYPINTAKATQLLGAAGTNTDINVVMSFLNGQYAAATTGIATNGNTLQINEVNAASMYMLGIEISNPCDINTTSGPLSVPCLQLLYDNKADKYGPTYTNTFGAFTSFCNNKGTASPIDKNGKINTEAVTNALKAIPAPGTGSSSAVKSVQNYFNKILTNANMAANASNSEIVMDALAACYGINIPNQGPEQTKCDQNLLGLYDVSQANTNNINSNRIVFPNVQTMGPMADVDLIMVKNGGTIQVNQNTIATTSYSDPGVYTSVLCRNAISINFWVKPGNPPTNMGVNFFLFDFRPTLNDTYMYSPGDGSLGSFWNTGNKLFIDGVAAKTWKSILDNKWHLVTVNLAKPYTGLLKMFNANDGYGAMNCEFGPIGIYQQTRQQSDILADFNARPTWAQTPNFMGYFYQGCFGDSWDRALPYYSGQVSSVIQCAQIASNMGMNSFGVQYFGQCWTGNSPIHDYTRYGIVNGCPPLGGGWNNQVYVNTEMQTKGFPCKVLGGYGMGPWGAGSRFVDNSAYWIWDDQNAASNTAAGKWINFNLQINVDVPCYAVFYLIVDDEGELFVNNVSQGQITGGGWGTTNYTKRKIQIPSGQVNLRIKAKNNGGPGGLLGSLVRADGVVLARTDRTWSVTY